MLSEYTSLGSISHEQVLDILHNGVCDEAFAPGTQPKRSASPGKRGIKPSLSLNTHH